MFGTIMIPVAAIEIDSNELVSHIISEAKYHKRRSHDLFKQRDAVGIGGEWAVWQALNSAAHQSDLTVKRVSRPLRSAIEARTRHEREQAESEVRMGQVRFVGPACGDETCGDCELPLWHHIYAADGRLLCPFGRAFWTLARAIHTHHERHDTELGGCKLAWIAKR